jgi:hypothetical protein
MEHIEEHKSQNTNHKNISILTAAILCKLLHIYYKHKSQITKLPFIGGYIPKTQIANHKPQNVGHVIRRYMTFCDL